LKYDFAADSFCLNNFFATEACLNTVMMAYNLMSLFRQAALKLSVIERQGRSTHASELALQAVREGGLHHDRGTEKRAQTGHRHASARVV